ncbi:MAG TPA: hypothetical protein VK188_00805, partial [Holophaga sp.]|nr:hypothetical protein [Holophaga sp.]
MLRNLAKLIICLAFTWIGGTAILSGDRSQVSWSIPATLLFFLGALFFLMRLLKRKPPARPRPPSARVLVDGNRIACIHPGGPEEAVLWADLEEVLILAEDVFPIGEIYWVLRGANRSGCAVPWDAVDARELLAAMQERLPGFDHGAVIAASGMLDGAVRVWQKGNPVSRPAADGTDMLGHPTASNCIAMSPASPAPKGLLLTAALLASASALRAQEPPSPPAPPAAPAPKPPQVLEAGTLVVLEMDEQVSTGANKADDFFRLHVKTPVLVAGRVAIPAGAKALGQIIDCQGPKIFGHPAKLLLAIRHAEAEGRRIPLRFLGPYRGEDRTQEGVVVSFIPVVGLFAPFIKGGEIILPAGTALVAKVAKDTPRMWLERKA